MSPCLPHEVRSENAHAEPGPKGRRSMSRGRRSMSCGHRSISVGRGGGLISRASSRIRKRLAGEGGNTREDRDEAPTTARVDRDPSPARDVEPRHVPTPRDTLVRRQLGAVPSPFDDDASSDSTISSKTNFRGHAWVEIDLPGPGAETPRRGTCVTPSHVPTPRDVHVRRQLGIAPSPFGGGDDDEDDASSDSTISSKASFRSHARVEVDFSGPSEKGETPRRHGRRTCVTPSPHRRSRTVQQDIPRHVTPATHASAAVWGEVLALSRGMSRS